MFNIECKVGKNKLTPPQCMYALRMLEMGAIFIEARNVDDWLEILSDDYDSQKWIDYVKTQLPKNVIY